MKAITLAMILGSTIAMTKTVDASTWSIDASHANAQFSVKHMMVSNVRGAFSNITGTVELNDKDIAKSRVNVEIDASTIDTRNEKRDAHLKSDDFFDVTKYPTMTFKSTKVKRTGKGKLKITGDLTIRGVTRSVILDVEGPTPEMTSPWGQTVRGVHATTKINRKDWGLTWNKALETGGLLVGEDVEITLDVELIKGENKAS
jgi:polyisoprenoid-binding protein YceI